MRAAVTGATALVMPQLPVQPVDLVVEVAVGAVEARVIAGVDREVVVEVGRGPAEHVVALLAGLGRPVSGDDRSHLGVDLQGRGN